MQPAHGAPLLRFGVNPAGEAGALGPRVEPVPDVPRKTYAALDALRGPGPFYVRLNRFFWSDGAAAVRRFLALSRRYTRRGYLVELQLRYHPRPDQEGDIGAWVRFVKKVVRRFGPNPGVRSLQVTNEVNFLPIAPDASDSAYRGAREALVRGVIAADRVAQRRGFGHLKIGFNWAYRSDPLSERSFWNELATRGGPRFVEALDWVGLDAYPGTVFPPLELGDGYRDGMVNAMSVLRECYMPIAGIPPAVPIKVEENGYPTLEPVRTYAEQVNAMRQMVWAVHEFRGTYNVTDYRWFDLRDHRTSSLNFQHQYGLLRDDYSPKPAFAVYADLVEQLARR
ncbi:MAG TPA: hypothetical protein VHF58_03535 [Solirubrobacterales bacterium]|nr:hypothetical protein [Solirubrobacterales bacterium]